MAAQYEPLLANKADGVIKEPTGGAYVLPASTLVDTPTVGGQPTPMSYVDDADDLKADKVLTPTAGNLASLDADGNLVDSEVKPGDFPTLTIPAETGNLASLAADGSLADSGVKSVTTKNATRTLMLKGDSAAPVDGDTRLYHDDDGDIAMGKYDGTGEAWGLGSIKTAAASIQVGTQVSFTGTGNVAAYNLKKSPGETRLFPFYTFDENGTVSELKQSVILGTTDSTVEFFDGATNHEAVLSAGRYRLSELNADVSANSVITSQILRAGAVNPTSSVRLRIYEDDDLLDENKLIVDMYIPASAWTGKIPGDYITFCLCFDGDPTPISALAGENYTIVYDSDEAFSLYGDATKFYSGVTGKEFEYQKVLTEKSVIPCTKEFFLKPSDGWSSTTGDFPVERLNADGDVQFAFPVPNDFTSIIDAVVVIIPDATETIQYDIEADVAAVGEVYNADNRSLANQTKAVIDNVMTEIDVSGVLSGLATGDYVGLDFNSDTEYISVVGMRFKYI